jgi:DHA2 family multidrug resistance protein
VAAALARPAITATVVLATLIQALDSTIANVALPRMQASLGGTQQTLAWVLTSYVVAAAISMPLTGFLAARWGRRRVFVASVIGFTLASVACRAPSARSSCRCRSRCCSTRGRANVTEPRWRSGGWA